MARMAWSASGWKIARHGAAQGVAGRGSSAVVEDHWHRTRLCLSVRRGRHDLYDWWRRNRCHSLATEFWSRPSSATFRGSGVGHQENHPGLVAPLAAWRSFLRGTRQSRTDGPRSRGNYRSWGECRERSSRLRGVALARDNQSDRPSPGTTDLGAQGPAKSQPWKGVSRNPCMHPGSGAPYRKRNDPRRSSSTNSTPYYAQTKPPA